MIPIGCYGTLTPDKARATAKDYLQRLDKGENPHPKVQVKREIITVKDLYSQYINSRKTPLAESTVYQYDSWMNNHFKDLKPLPADTITGVNVVERLSDMEKNSKRPLKMSNCRRYETGPLCYDEIKHITSR